MCVILGSGKYPRPRLPVVLMANSPKAAAKKKKAPVLTPPQQFARAAQMGDLTVVTEMCEKWVGSATALGNTALHWSAAAGHAHVVAHLLQNGADPSATNDQGDTPLHSAAWRGFAKTATLLLNAGASREAKNKSGKTPPQLALAKYSEDHEILRVLPKFTNAELAELDDFAVDSSGGESDCEDAVTL